MTRLLFRNELYDELMVPTRTGSMKLFKSDIVEGNSYQPLVDKGFLVQITEEQIKEKPIKYVFYTAPYLMRSK